MKKIVIVEGIRTPFAKAWTSLEDIPAQRLGAICCRELLERTHLDPARVDEVIFGCVAQPAEAANIARVISLYAGIPFGKRAYTVSRNCASGLEAITSAAEKIQCGLDEIVIAGGTESMSNIPLLFGKEISRIFRKLSRARSMVEKARLVLQMRPRHFKPRIGLAMGLTDPVCGLNMGQTAEVLAKEFGITREEQDRFALTSHKRAVASRPVLREEIVPVLTGTEDSAVIEADNGPHDHQTVEALGKFKPYFDRHSGTVTVGNSCQVTDGACALLVMEEEKAKALGLEVLGSIRAYAYHGLEPQKMGLGPAYAIPSVLKKAGLKLRDIDLFEINEAFACQVLACVEALGSKEFCREHFGTGEAVGTIDKDRLNVNGGAIALGHPVGVSGARLVLTLLKEMKRRNVPFGLASLCVGGGQGGAIILER